MKIETLLSHEFSPPYAVQTIKIAEFTCPNCREQFRYVLPEDAKIGNLRSWIDENTMLKKEVQRLHFELQKMNQISKLNNGYL